MGWYSYTILLMTSLYCASLTPTSSDDLTINLNVNDSPQVCHNFGRGHFRSEEEEDNNKLSKDVACPKRRNQQDELQRNKKRKRILGGFPYNPKNWKIGEPDWEHWIASIKITYNKILPNGKNKTSFCSGVLISKLHILTALHCIVDNMNPDLEKAKLLLPLENVAIYFDVNNAKIWRGSMFTSAKFSYVNMKDGKVKFHKNNPKKIKDDIAVIQLDREVTWEDNCLRPIKFTNQPLKRDHSGAIVLPGHYWMAGWGLYKFTPGVNPKPRVLQYTNQLKHIPCPTALYDFDKKICFERTNQHATCSGDSGSPGVIKKKDDAGDISWVLQGIHSAGKRAPGYKTHQCNKTKSVGVDINAFKYRTEIMEWIKPYKLSELD